MFPRFIKYSEEVSFPRKLTLEGFRGKCVKHHYHHSKQFHRPSTHSRVWSSRPPRSQLQAHVAPRTQTGAPLELSLQRHPRHPTRHCRSACPTRSWPSSAPTGPELPVKGTGFVSCHAPWGPQNPAETRAAVESISRLLHGQSLGIDLGNEHVYNKVLLHMRRGTCELTDTGDRLVAA